MNLVDGSVWRNGRFEPDEWVRWEPDLAAPSPGQPLLVPLAAFVAEPDRFLGHDGPLGVEIGPGEAIAGLQPYLPRLALIALAFPKFHDGRNYSTARLLKERFGYPGEMRAVGDVLADQIPLMRRCGITSFEVRHPPTRAALLAGRLPEMHRFYQPIPTAAEAPAGTRPWLRQPA